MDQRAVEPHHFALILACSLAVPGIAHGPGGRCYFPPDTAPPAASLAGGNHAGGAPVRSPVCFAASCELPAKCQMPPASELDQGTPRAVNEAVFDQLSPEPVRALVQVRHGEVREQRAAVGGPAMPNRTMGEQAPVAPGVALGQLLDLHVARLEHDVGRVVARPVAVQESTFRFELTEQRRARVGRQDVERRALQALGLDPVHEFRETIRVIVVEAQYEAAVDLDAVVVQQGDALCVFLRPRRFLARVREVGPAEGFEAHEDAGATGQGHFAHQGRIVGGVDRDCRAPDFFKGLQGLTQRAQVFGIRAEVVVDEHAVGLSVSFEFARDLGWIADLVGQMQPSVAR